MRAYLPLVVSLFAVLQTSCVTQHSDVLGWPDSQVFKMPQPTSFMSETLELKDGRFRYWFSSDVILRNGPKYPMEGSYAWKGDEILLSSDKSFKVRRINGQSVLFWPHAVEWWDRHQIISGHILVPVGSIHSPTPQRENFFTKEQRETSAARAAQLQQNK
ncbi:MAG: hypothetical protein AB1705_06200 [Verrucomicrobiota bacterium]